jgi:hypothetical protein
MSNLRITLKGFNRYLVDFWEAEVAVNKVVVAVAVLEICLASEESHFPIFISELLKLSKLTHK